MATLTAFNRTIMTQKKIAIDDELNYIKSIVEVLGWKNSIGAHQLVSFLV